MSAGAHHWSGRRSGAGLRCSGAGTTDLIRNIRDNPAVLVSDPAKELRSFRAFTAPLGTKRGQGWGSFIDSVREAVDTFYGEVLQHIKAWTAAPEPVQVSTDGVPGGSASRPRT
jgi:hypothetical protein